MRPLLCTLSNRHPIGHAEELLYQSIKAALADPAESLRYE